ncbi:hypothetical protein IQ250_04135 [Pseudanabaenaceae cyanobacterium LEGE 13415]|nr:hypothetical protein [Pseudanabaenaceae cyanobacterium LEGE 13415]
MPPYSCNNAWLEYRVTERRFRANPEMIPAIARLICEAILDLSQEESFDEQQSLLCRLMLEQFYRDLPAALRSEMNAIPELNAYFQIEIIEAVNLSVFDPEHCPIFSAPEFLSAIAAAVNGDEAEITASNSELVYRIHAVHRSDTVLDLHFTNLATAQTFAMRDDALVLASENPKVREQVLRANSAWFDCDPSTHEAAIAEIVATTDFRRRIEQANRWRRESAKCFYESFQQKLYEDQEFTTEDLIPTSSAGLLRHFYLAPRLSEPISFGERLETTAVSMLAVNDLETCLERVSYFPTKLPQHLKEAFLDLPPDERTQLLERLVVKLTSPICQLHLLELAVSCPGSISIAQQLFNSLLSEDGKLQFQLFATILQLVDEEFSYWLEVRQWSPLIRLAITWAHTSQLYNLLYAPDVDVEAFIQELNRLAQVRQISAEILDRNIKLWNDILSPRRLNRVRLIMGGMESIFQDCERSVLEAIGVERLTNLAVRTLGDQRFLDISLWHDEHTLASDSLGALWGGNQRRNLALVLGEDLAQQGTPDSLKATVERAIEMLETEPTNANQWNLLACILGDLPIYADLVERLSYLAKTTNFVELYEADPTIAFVALRVACDHTASTANEELRAKLEAELIAIARVIEIQERVSQNDNLSAQLLECALKVAVRANDPRGTSIFLNRLLEQIATAWYQFSDIYAENLALVTLNLPIDQLHGAWTINLKLRALRSY